MLKERRILTGYNNDNYIMNIGAEKVVLRIPVSHRYENDIRSLSEGRVLEYLQRKMSNIPPVICYDQRNDLILERLLEGKTLDQYYDVETKIPDRYIGELADFFVTLHSLDPFEADLGHIYGEDEGRSFYSAVLDHTQMICLRYIDSMPDLYSRLRISRRDVTSFFDRMNSCLPETGISLCHCDVHRKNILVSKEDRLIILDWELALIGDPLYDIAIHFQKMRYSDSDIDVFLSSYYKGESSAKIIEHLNRIRRYMQTEAVKYAVVDIQHVLSSAKAGAINELTVKRYYKKLTNALTAMDIPESISMDDLNEICSIRR